MISRDKKRRQQNLTNIMPHTHTCTYAYAHVVTQSIQCRNLVPRCINANKTLKFNSTILYITTYRYTKTSNVCCIYGPRPAKIYLRACAKSTSFGSSHVCAKSRMGFCSPLKHFIVSNDSVSGQWRSWLDCADAQRDVFAWRGPYIELPLLILVYTVDSRYLDLAYLE